MPTILQINVSVNTGSTGRIAEEIGQRAMVAGYDSYIAYGRAARESCSKLIRIGTRWDYLVHGVKSLLFDAHGFGSKRATRRLVKQIDEIKPDVILFHNLHGYYLNIDVLLSYLKDNSIPIFWTLHDCWPFTGHCSYFDGCGCNKWKTHCKHCPNKRGYPKSIVFDRSYSNFDKKIALISALQILTFIPVCKWMGGVLCSSRIACMNQRVIYNGVDVGVFKPQSDDAVSLSKSEFGVVGKKIILGVASIWDKRKGLDDFIWLAAHLPENYRVILVGLTQKQIGRLPDNIIGIRRTESVGQLATIYSMSDVFVNPTYIDNFPTTNIEALACGTPVVTYNTGGSPEAVDDDTGIVVPQGDKVALLNAIKEITNAKDRYTQEMCRKRAVDNFNKDDRFDDYIQLFNKAIGR